MKKIPEEVRYDFAVMIDDMIYDMLEENTNMSSKMAIKILANHYDVDVEDLRLCLLNNESPFIVGSIIIYHDGERFVRRTTLLARVGRIYRNKIIPELQRICGLDSTDACGDEIFDVIKDCYAPV